MTEQQPEAPDEIRRLEISVTAGDALIREILEALCRRDGLPLESSVVPGEPARNYDLAIRLGIGHVFGCNPWTKSPGVALIAVERSRQVTAEGYTPGHDAEHDGGELAEAAAAYALAANGDGACREFWSRGSRSRGTASARERFRMPDIPGPTAEPTVQGTPWSLGELLDIGREFMAEHGVVLEGAEHG